MKTIHFASMALVTLGLSSLGCVHAETAQIGNPLVTGQIAENTIKFPDRTTAMKYALPIMSFVQEASLKSLDDKEVCFALKLQAEGGRKDLVSPKGWRVFLRGDPTFEDMSPVVKDVAEVSEETVQGTVTNVQHHNQHICDSTGYCVDNDVSTTTHDPTDVKILTGGGTVCFANKGNINKGSKEITLHLDDPNPGMGGGAQVMTMGMGGMQQNRVAFRWKFN